uniref:Uncharacterized protein n=1 Tax=Trypanosoma vivax (strain Y486) TaxID=1055687 RepID=G0TS02_TRYVY|nr:hypothetical protein, unlikely [Trypanosoma vivax Y486]
MGKTHRRCTTAYVQPGKGKLSRRSRRTFSWRQISVRQCLGFCSSRHKQSVLVGLFRRENEEVWCDVVRSDAQQTRNDWRCKACHPAGLASYSPPPVAFHLLEQRGRPLVCVGAFAHTQEGCGNKKKGQKKKKRRRKKEREREQDGNEGKSLN